MEIGDIVVRKSYGKDITFKIIDIKYDNKGIIYVLKGIDLRIVADAREDDLEYEEKDIVKKKEATFNRKVNNSIKKILTDRNYRGEGQEIRKKTKGDKQTKGEKQPKDNKQLKVNSSTMLFGRPGRVLHIDGDPEYLDVCLKTYKQLSVEAVGRVIPEAEQPKRVLELVRELRPDIVVLTGHDAIIKNAEDYMSLNSYKNSKYFVDTVTALRNYEPNYDDLVIFAGACQSCYEAILDAGANYASSPNRVLIHCLDPVFLCEKIAYTNVEKIVSIHEAIENTITGIDGIGGLQTRGKYREGFPKSKYS